MKTWDDWTDEDLSHAILIAIHGEVINFFTLSDCKTYIYDCGVIGESFYRVDLIDINNPADMWPIIVESKISLIMIRGGYQAVNKDWDYIDLSGHDDINDCCIDPEALQYGHINPLRAAAIVFLMMNGVNPE